MVVLVGAIQQSTDTCVHVNEFGANSRQTRLIWRIAR